MLNLRTLARKVLRRDGRYFHPKSLIQYSTANRTTVGVRLPGDKRAERLHVTARTQYPLAKPLRLPSNLEDVLWAEKLQFSPHRERDLTGPMIVCKEPGAWGAAEGRGAPPAVDPHLQSYDCASTVSLTCAMQSNVPRPFSALGKATHLNMPGGQWGRADRWVSQDMQELHCRGLGSAAGGAPPSLSRKERLKAAVRDYGATVVVFHVGISLLSLGAFYTAVSSGLDMAHWLGQLGVDAGQVAAGASTFVVAYAVHKVFAPVRIGITLACTPFIVRYLRGVGLLKPPKAT
ncbi:uncharacterized protein LOC134534226 [Bacillus rossius redtenbacheri]|uniref:uncharacterized protein LOC134534226 n=1 Tax=Bacillus rossius redtenbacheri TaxID=93214 RepID=UPI002FDE9CB8